MANRPNHAVLENLRTLFDTGTAAALTNRELVERFMADQPGRSELAFTALVHRHGPMVLHVCRNVLHDSHAAEDAFQVTFLIPARRIGSIRRPDSLAAWLHGVAVRVATSSRLAAARRTRHETHETGHRSSDHRDPEVTEQAFVIQEEIARLPEKPRDAVVLCYFQGMTNEQAAEELGWPIGTIYSRLAWARERLKVRLIRRGMAPTALALTTLGPIEMVVPTALENLTVRLAIQAPSGAVSTSLITLTNVVLRTYFMTKIKLIAIGLATAGLVVAVGTGLATGRQAADTPETKVVRPSVVTVVGPSSGAAPSVSDLQPVRDPAAESSQILKVKLKYALRAWSKKEEMGKQMIISQENLDLAHSNLELIIAQIETQRDDLRDQSEQLMAQLAVKQADLAVSRNLAAQTATATSERATLVPLKEAEYNAVEVRMKQVERRLKAAEALVKLANPPTDPEPAKPPLAEPGPRH